MCYSNLSAVFGVTIDLFSDRCKRLRCQSTVNLFRHASNVLYTWSFEAKFIEVDCAIYNMICLNNDLHWNVQFWTTFRAENKEILSSHRGFALWNLKSKHFPCNWLAKLLILLSLPRFVTFEKSLPRTGQSHNVNALYFHSKHDARRISVGAQPWKYQNPK